MKFALRWLGRILIVLALMALGADIVRSLEAGTVSLAPAGLTWFQLHLDSLNGTQVLIQRHLRLPLLWDPVMQTVLLWPTVFVLGVPGAAFALLGRETTTGRRKGGFR